MAKQESKPDAVIFGYLDRSAEIEIRERNLPHWFQSGAAIFVTFRTADSLPKEVVLRWQAELEEWLGRNELPLRLADFATGRSSKQAKRLFDSVPPDKQTEFKRLNDRIWHRSLDECHGECLLKQPALAEIVGEAMLYYEQRKYDLDCFVVMPNHVHAIVQFRTGASLQTVGQSWMRFTARRINALIDRSGPFWQPEPFDHIIRSSGQFEYLQGYVAQNPKKAKLKPGEFLYWERPVYSSCPNCSEPRVWFASCASPELVGG
jgi:REP element-mobilizing transposase RayT